MRIKMRTCLVEKHYEGLVSARAPVGLPTVECSGEHGIKSQDMGFCSNSALNQMRVFGETCLFTNSSLPICKGLGVEGS